MQPEESPGEVAPHSGAESCLGHDESCPLCGKDNQCHVAKGHLYKGVCWCDKIIFPGHLLKLLAVNWTEPACLCRPCLETISQVSRTTENADAALAQVYRLIRPATPPLASEDYYVNDDGNTVFTAAYHLKRGSCCNNACRHCPY